MKFISVSVAIVLSLVSVAAASPAPVPAPAEIVKRCSVLHCRDADPSTCCSDKYGYCNTDTGECHCGKDCT
ncbi:uncharacterized protein N7506_005528 [Penicillium brevicompactum]|uniref:uncharacterized protein n=1 Tax=Penicillium brevicompactum TaxID=5074 RepID=UPI00253FCFAD|nr:uncharacterized protein N7506_005528 [Penicillium brevicompactum]KAJ5337506.1 hypothetical protein N7506_005528 [Penicillium brevicompactum]